MDKRIDIGSEELVWSTLISEVGQLGSDHREQIYESVQFMIKCSDISRMTNKYINQISKIKTKKA